MRAAFWLAALLIVAFPARADLIFPNLVYRDGPYASGGSALADGYADYFTLLNERDGGINGVPIQVPECDTGFNADRGVECYEGVRSLAPHLLQPFSTSIALRLLPRAAADGIPLHGMGYGPSFIDDGAVFRWAFSHPAHGWDALTIIVRHMLDQAGGSLAGKRVAMVYHNSPYGQEAVPILRELARKHRFGLRLHAIDHPGQEQRAAWAGIAGEAPDFVALWGWGIMNRVALEEAIAIGYPMERIIGTWWSATEADILAAGEAAHGYKAILFHKPGGDFPLYGDLRKYVFERGKAAGTGANAGSIQYNFGLYAAVLAAEAARSAMRQHDTTAITPRMMRDGLEKLSLDQARMRRLGLPGFGPDIAMSCTDHGGPGLAAVHQWDARAGRWIQTTGMIESDRELLAPLIREEAARHVRDAAAGPAECAR